jgi:CHAT domain-containing protein/Tfp pilus assembly protein PilF
MNKPRYKSLQPGRLARFRIGLFFALAFSLVNIFNIGIAYELPGTEARVDLLQETVHLKLGEPIERQITAGERQAYEIQLPSGQYVRIVVEQRGIDVELILLGPDGKELRKVDSPNGKQGPEILTFVSESQGNYQLIIRPLGKTAEIGHYAARLEELRSVTERDKVWVLAERSLAEASRLKAEEKIESTKEALEKYKEAASLYRSLADPRMEAIALHEAGLAYRTLGDVRTSLEYYYRALPLREAARDRAGEALTLNNIGWNHNLLGEMDKALDYLNRSLAIRQEMGNRSREADTLNNIGAVLYALGEYQKALNNYHQAVLKSQEAKHRWAEAEALHNIGGIYADIGEKQKAINYYEVALPIRREVNERVGEANTLMRMGTASFDLGENDKALKLYNQALEIRRKLKDRFWEGDNLNRIGEFYHRTADYQKALSHYEQALELRQKVDYRRGVADTLTRIGAVYQDIGDYKAALGYHQRAFDHFRAVSHPGGEARSRLGLARALWASGEQGKAKDQIEAAIAILESQRVKASGSQELRASYFASARRFYEFYIDLLMSLHKQHPANGFEVAAFHASERFRARSLLDLLAESKADIRQGVEKELLKRELGLQQLLNEKSERQIRLLSGRHTEEQATTLRNEINPIINELEQIEAQIRMTSPRYASLTLPTPLTIKQVQQLLDDQTVLLQYALGEKDSYLWVVTQTSVQTMRLPKREELEPVARRLYEALLGPYQPYLNAQDQMRKILEVKSHGKPSEEVATVLSRLVLGPASAYLGKKRLLIVADGALQYVPFAALPDPAVEKQKGKSQPLIFNHEVIHLPSASILATQRRLLNGRKPAGKTLAILADPVFDLEDERVRPDSGAPHNTSALKSGIQEDFTVNVLQRLVRERGDSKRDLKFLRLRGTKREAEQIGGLVPDVDKMLAFDFDASREKVTGNELSGFQYVHFATHGVLNSEIPGLSGLMLSMVDRRGNPQDGFLRAHELFNLNLPVELVVLSACQTGIGKEIKGEGLIGLTRGLMYAGAKRVVVSLWSVDDQATADLMIEFYRGMITKKMRPAAALRAAQIEMSKKPRWSAPYYWAGFVLQGEWK